MKSQIFSIVTLCAAILMVAHRVETEPLARVEVTVLTTDVQSQVAAVRIDRILPIVDGDPQEPTDTLVVACPNNDMLYWKTVLVVGDTIKLVWRITNPARSGWLLFGYQAQEAELAIPDSGISRTCECKNKTDQIEARLTAKFLDAFGELRSSLDFKGKSIAFPLRLIPFIKGNRATPDGPISIVFGWDSVLESGCRQQSSNGGRP